MEDVTKYDQDTSAPPLSPPNGKRNCQTKPGLRILFKKIKGTDNYWASPIDLRTFWCPNSPYCPKGSGTHSCLFPKLIEDHNGHLKTKGSISLSCKIPGGMICINQSFLEKLGVTFYMKVRGCIATLFTWRNPNFGNEDLRFVIIFSGKDFKTKVEGSTSDKGIKLSKENIMLNSVIKFKISIKLEESYSLPKE